MHPAVVYGRVERLAEGYGGQAVVPICGVKEDGRLVVHAVGVKPQHLEAVLDPVGGQRVGAAVRTEECVHVDSRQHGVGRIIQTAGEAHVGGIAHVVHVDFVRVPTNIAVNGDQCVGAPGQLKDMRVRGFFGETSIIGAGETGRVGQAEHAYVARQTTSADDQRVGEAAGLKDVQGIGVGIKTVVGHLDIAQVGRVCRVDNIEPRVDGTRRRAHQPVGVAARLEGVSADMVINIRRRTVYIAELDGGGRVGDVEGPDGTPHAVGPHRHQVGVLAGPVGVHVVHYVTAGGIKLRDWNRGGRVGEVDHLDEAV